MNNYGYKVECEEVPISFPKQHQKKQPGLEYLMNPRPIFDDKSYVPTDKLKNKVLLISGGDSGIGRATAVLFAKEGADIAFIYFDEDIDAFETKQYVEALGRKCLMIRGDLTKEEFIKEAVKKTLDVFGKIDILINNIGVQYPQPNFLDISNEQLLHTFKTNIFSYFYLTKEVLPHLKENSCIINTTSSDAYSGNKLLIDYSASTAGIIGFTRSLALSLVDKNIRVNGVAPGTIWTPLYPSSFDGDYIETLGYKTPMKRAGEPVEVAPAYLYLASDEASYITGQIIHVDGGVTTS